MPSKASPVPVQARAAGRARRRSAFAAGLALLAGASCVEPDAPPTVRPLEPTPPPMPARASAPSAPAPGEGAAPAPRPFDGDFCGALCLGQAADPDCRARCERDLLPPEEALGRARASTPAAGVAPAASGPPPSCEAARECGPCVRLGFCGFCADHGRCVSGYESGPRAGTCEDWRWGPERCAGRPAAAPEIPRRRRASKGRP